MPVRVSRRTFLKALAVAGGSAAAANFLGGGWGVLREERGSAAATAAEEWVPTACWIGKQDCGMLARRVGGRVVKLEGLPSHPRNLGTLCPKGVAQITALYDPSRLRRPLIRTNEKGIPGRFREASWDEALDLVAAKIREARAKDPKLVVWQKGRSKSAALYDNSFATTLGATKLHHGAFCSDAGYRASEYTLGLNGVLHPDYGHCRYIVHWGFNLTNAGGNKLCWITFPRQVIEAKERGAKVVHIDPRLHAAGPHADWWIPIRPGTDLALALALINRVLERGQVDRDYLRSYTNAPFLVQDDGTFLRLDGREQVWDEDARQPVAYDAASRPILDGAFEWQGKRLRTAFRVLREHVAPYTPERAARVCDITAPDIRRLADEMVDNALIGSTIEVDGARMPHRPVAIHTYHFSQQELGFQAVRAMIILMMLLGAPGAVGGQFVDFGWKLHPNFEKLGQVSIKGPPYNVWLENSPYFPINSNNSAIAALALKGPEQWGVDPAKLPEVMIVHMTNPVVAFGSSQDILEGFKRVPFIVVLDPWLSKTADLLADVVLPVSTLEKYEGPLGATDGYVDAVALRLPVMEPLGESRSELEIYLDLAERIGVLDAYLEALNKELGLKAPYVLTPGRKPTPREVFDLWAKSQGVAEGLAYFEKHGVLVKGRLTPDKIYGYAQKPPFGGIRHRLYGESLLLMQREAQRRGVDEVFWRDYTPLPTWREPTMERSPREYDLYLVSFKLIEFKQGRGTNLPLVAELAPQQRLWMNPGAAAARGIREGDEVWVESHNALTGETKRVRVKVSLTEGIRPDTVGLPHHYGDIARHPWSQHQGPGAAELFFTGPGYVANTADQSFQVKVRVYKACEGR
jgi:anaerobic selenocysteine-containing dehydrogenase